MRSTFLLYSQGHRLGIASAIITVALIFAVVAEETLIPLPWLTGTSNMNIGVPCALVICAAVLAIFRNELSRLESRQRHTWFRIDAAVLATIWTLLGVVAGLGLTSSRMVYMATILIAISLLCGRVMRTDTLALLLIAQLIAHSTLWRPLENNPLRYLVFLSNTPPPSTIAIVTAAAFAVALASVTGFKRYAG